MNEKIVSFEPARFYFKFGDDFHDCLNQRTVPEAFLELADRLESGATTYRRIAEILKNCPKVEGQGDTHAVYIELPESVAKTLAKEDLGDIATFE